MAEKKLKGAFVKDVLSGKADVKDIHDYIDTWRYEKDIDCEVHTFLGMSREDYQEWLVDDLGLKRIIEKYKENT